MGHKALRQLETSTRLAQELPMNIQCSGGSRSFAKETRALKMRGIVGSHWKLTTTNWKHHWSWSSYNYMRSCLRTECWPFYGRLAFEANAERWKNLIGGCLMNWPQIKKLVILKHHLLLFYTTTMNHFSIELWPVMKRGFYTTIGDD